MKLFLFILSFLFSINFFSQSSSKVNFTYKVEEYILEKKLDSASLYLDSIKENKYKNTLVKLVNKRAVTNN